MGNPKKCPHCNLYNPPSAQRCDCGYVFVPGNEAVDAAIGRKLTAQHNVRFMIQGGAGIAICTVSLLLGLVGGFFSERMALLLSIAGIILFFRGVLGLVFRFRA
jgi:hypothetical protein